MLPLVSLSWNLAHQTGEKMRLRILWDACTCVWRSRHDQEIQNLYIQKILPHTGTGMDTNSSANAYIHKHKHIHTNIYIYRERELLQGVESLFKAGKKFRFQLLRSERRKGNFILVLSIQTNVYKEYICIP